MPFRPRLAPDVSSQVAARLELQYLRIDELLAPCTPTLVGSVPLKIDVDGSDLDIVCAAYHLESFASLLESQFGRRPGFHLKRRRWQDQESVVASFDGRWFPIEIFAQAKPVILQNGFRHLVAETHLLELGGDRARQAIRWLKRAGLSTEPAFAHYFRLPGDPYQTLLHLSWLDRRALQQWVGSSSRLRPPGSIDPSSSSLPDR